MSKCVGGGAGGGCADGNGGGDGSVVVLIDHHCSNDCFAGTLVLCRAGDRVAAGVSFLSIFGRGFCGGSVDAFASGGVSVARTFSNFGSGGVVVRF